MALFYFSGTGNTERIAEAIANELTEKNVEINNFNITSYKERQQNYDLASYNVIIFGFPIYAWRAPSVVRTWLKSLNGNGKKCATFFTYGGVSTGVAHYNTMKILEGSNFILIGSSEFPGKHTFNLAGWNLLENRPDKGDFEIAKEFARKILKKFQEKDFNKIEIGDPTISEQILERHEKREKNLPTPSRRGADCSMCRTCEQVCPSGAMNADTGEVDNNKCLRCLRCMINCPDNVLEIADMSKLSKFILNANNITKNELERKVSKIYC
ncbi:MAG: EFR1 family ferrodoxin [Promethearchaeota archaeon]